MIQSNNSPCQCRWNSSCNYSWIIEWRLEGDMSRGKEIKPLPRFHWNLYLFLILASFRLKKIFSTILVGSADTPVKVLFSLCYFTFICYPSRRCSLNEFHCTYTIYWTDLELVFHMTSASFLNDSFDISVFVILHLICNSHLIFVVICMWFRGAWLSPLCE